MISMRQILVSVFALALVTGCNSRKEGGGSPGSKPGGALGPGQHSPVSCVEFEEFMSVYREMEKHRELLIGVPDRQNRLILASGLLSSFLTPVTGYSVALNNNSYQVREVFIKSFSWIFNEEGFVRHQPNHPKARICLKGEGK